MIDQRVEVSLVNKPIQLSNEEQDRAQRKSYHTIEQTDVRKSFAFTPKANRVLPWIEKPMYQASRILAPRSRELSEAKSSKMLRVLRDCEIPGTPTTPISQKLQACTEHELLETEAGWNLPEFTDQKLPKAKDLDKPEIEKFLESHPQRKGTLSVSWLV
ncbi:hypothetical protein J6590_007765 [Homalodisca vitripennis]|nr:hypothetical protein J6590_007765 [Homalodisca vitripennis]